MSFEDETYRKGVYRANTAPSYASFAADTERCSGRPGPIMATRRTGTGTVRRRPGFDRVRPGWLDDSVDVSRPELGANFDAPDDGPRSTHLADEIDEPYDHRIGTVRHRGAQPPAVTAGQPVHAVIAAAGDVGVIPIQLLEELLHHIERLQRDLRDPYPLNTAEPAPRRTTPS
jgi:hypothetical protein